MIGFSVAIISTLLWPTLPTTSVTITSVVFGILLLKRAPTIAGALLAVGWISIFVQLLLVAESPNKAQNLIVKGEIISLVRSNSDWVRMDIRLSKSKSENIITKVIRVSWQQAPKVSIGEYWELSIRPKPITSVLNQGGYNQQRSLLSKHIVMKGRVISGVKISDADSWRNLIIAKLTPSLTSLDHGDLLLALLVGDKSQISQARWHALRLTGSGHLISISGLHLSVVAGWVYLLMAMVLYRFVPCVSRRNILIAGIISALSAICYAYLAGFALPTLRALIMLLMLLALSAIKRYSSPWERLLYALFLILLMDPLSCLSAGFWLSFSALGIILLAVNTENSISTEQTAKRKVLVNITLFWSVQWRLSLGLGMMQAMLFGGVSAYSLLFNFIFVPWFSFIVIPLAMLSFGLWLLGSVVGIDVHHVFGLVDLTLVPMSWAFEVVEALPSAWINISDQMIAGLGFCLLGVCLACKVRLFRWKLVSLSLGLPLIMMLLNEQLHLSRNEWKLHLLDVGQGLSAVIEKSGRSIIYDSGAAYGEDFTYAERVILPFLSSKGIASVDYLVISHSDNDHAGGAKVLLASFPEMTLISDVPYFYSTADEIEQAGSFSLKSHDATDRSLTNHNAENFNHSLQNCRPMRITWQGLTLEFIGPSEASKGNNGSCVLKVSDDRHRVLLTGDIEKKAEKQMLSEEVDLQSDVLIAPHHGSRTSSTAAFIQRVAPQSILVPAGFNNRYGFPKLDVIERYTAIGATVVVTGHAGQISMIFGREGRTITTYRSDLAPFWYNRLFRFGDLKNSE